MSDIPLSHFPAAQTTFQPPKFVLDNILLGDVCSSGASPLKHAQPNPDPNSPITAGLFRVNKGESLAYTYSYYEVKMMLEGEITITDKTGQTITAVKGDIVYLPNGCEVVFSSNSTGLAFYCGQRKEVSLL